MAGHIIGVAGRKGSGKSTFASILANDGWEEVAFATVLKDMLKVLFMDAGISPPTAVEMVDGSLKEMPTPVLGGKTPRHAMQTLGTEWRDTIDRYLWTNILLARIQNRPDMDFVITDVRFPHEVDAIHRAGGKVVKLVGRGNENDLSNHLSEVEVDTLVADYVIDNSGDIPDLHTKAVGLGWLVRRANLRVRPDMQDLHKFLTQE